MATYQVGKLCVTPIEKAGHALHQSAHSVSPCAANISIMRRLLPLSAQWCRAGKAISHQVQRPHGGALRPGSFDYKWGSLKMGRLPFALNAVNL